MSSPNISIRNKKVLNISLYCRFYKKGILTFVLSENRYTAFIDILGILLLNFQNRRFSGEQREGERGARCTHALRSGNVTT